MIKFYFTFIPYRWKAIFEAEKEGDALAKSVMNRWIFYISWGLASLIHSLNPSIIVVGGGVSAQGRPFTDRIKEKTLDMIMPSFAKGLDIVPASLGNDAGIIGAAYSLKISVEAG